MGYRRFHNGGSWADIIGAILAIIGVVLMGILGIAGVLLLIVAIMAIPGAVCAFLWTIAAGPIATATGATWPTAFTFWPAFAVFTIGFAVLGAVFKRSSHRTEVVTRSRG